MGNAISFEPHPADPEIFQHFLKGLEEIPRILEMYRPGRLLSPLTDVSAIQHKKGLFQSNHQSSGGSSEIREIVQPLPIITLHHISNESIQSLRA
jgi:hypothetical protein